MSINPVLDATWRLDSLDARLDGALVRPGDPAWDADRLAWQLAADQHPVAVVNARSEHDVALTLRTAAESGLRVAPQSTGHGAMTLGTLDGAVLLRTSGLDHVTIDAAARTATVGAGASWASVATAAAPHGLVGLAGSSPHVGVVGYTLGGGIGWLARLHGLSAHAPVSARVALPDGTVVVASESSHPDLLWALRGGGGVGVVTEATIRLHPLTTVVAGTLWWPASELRRVVRAWSMIAPSFPREVGSSARLLRFPDLDGVPDAVRGRSFAVIQVAVATDAVTAARLLAPLRALEPLMDDVREASPAALGDLAMDPPMPSHGVADGLVIAAHPRAVDAWVDAVESPSGAALAAADLRLLGGALTPDPGVHAALDGLPGALAAVAIAPVTPVVDRAAAGAAVAVALAAIEPWADRRQYANFVERRATSHDLLGSDAAARLVAIRTAYDPEGVVHRRHD